MVISEWIVQVSRGGSFSLHERERVVGLASKQASLCAHFGFNRLTNMVALQNDCEGFCIPSGPSNT